MTVLAEVAEVAERSSGSTPTATAMRQKIADEVGRPIATMQIEPDRGGFARLLAAIAEVTSAAGGSLHRGTCDYGIGLTRALAAAGLLVIECEQPAGNGAGGKGGADPIDAHLTVLAALRLEANQAQVPRAGVAVWLAVFRAERHPETSRAQRLRVRSSTVPSAKSRANEARTETRLPKSSPSSAEPATVIIAPHHSDPYAGAHYARGDVVPVPGPADTTIGQRHGRRSQSWAIPDAPPSEPGGKRLAIPTEGHPAE